MYQLFLTLFFPKMFKTTLQQFLQLKILLSVVLPELASSASIVQLFILAIY